MALTVRALLGEAYDFCFRVRVSRLEVPSRFRDKENRPGRDRLPPAAGLCKDAEANTPIPGWTGRSATCGQAAALLAPVSTPCACDSARGCLGVCFCVKTSSSFPALTLAILNCFVKRGNCFAHLYIEEFSCAYLRHRSPEAAWLLNFLTETLRGVRRRGRFPFCREGHISYTMSECNRNFQLSTPTRRIRINENSWAT